jgi:hypothetical protein
MARSKSTSGSKANRTYTNQEQTSTGTPSNVPDVKAVETGVTPAEAAAEVKPRKLEMVKTEARKNIVVPIKRVPGNLPGNLEDEIRRRAYELYQQRGTASGSEAEDWLTAEREVMQRYRQQSA